MRKSYFTGEAITYQLQVHCPTSSCPPKPTGFYAQVFTKHLKLPKFEKFPAWRRTENFVRHQGRPGWVVFRYRVRFSAPTNSEIKLQAARLRLPNNVLFRLHRQDSICLFHNQSRDQVLQQAIVRDHHKKSDNASCSMGTRELSTSSLRIPIRSLPREAKNIKLIGSFQLSTQLKQLSFPTKRMTIADKAFYLIIHISGDGDLQTAREQIRDQLDSFSRQFRKKNVTTYTEMPDDKALRKEGKSIVQLQLIPEEPATLIIPSLSLRYFHREEGILKAQTLPISIKVIPRTGSVILPRPTPAISNVANRSKKRQATELRPNTLLDSQGLQNQYFFLTHYFSLIMLFSPFALFLLFLGWHRIQQYRESNPHLQERQRAFREYRAKVQKLDSKDSSWSRLVLQALHHYLIERLSLSQKQLTSRDIEILLRPHLSSDKTAGDLDKLLIQVKTLEETIYGGSVIDEPASVLLSLDNILKQIDRNAPKQ